MKKIEHREIGVIARENFEFIELFLANNIDFFCNTSQSVSEAVTNAGVNNVVFLEQLQGIKLQSSTNYKVDIEEWPLDLLADYIQKTHHRYTESAMTRIKQMIATYKTDGGIEIESINKLDEVFNFLSGKLGAHMKKEELMLFPAIRRLANPMGQEPPKPAAVNTFVGNMIHEHTEQFEALQQIRILLNDYQGGKSELYNKIIVELLAFSRDLALHLHLENNILFPKALDLLKAG